MANRQIFNQCVEVTPQENQPAVQMVVNSNGSSNTNAQSQFVEGQTTPIDELKTNCVQKVIDMAASKKIQLDFEDVNRAIMRDSEEFIPYAPQILSHLLEIHTDSIPEQYMALFPSLLTSCLWGKPENIHPLVRLLQVYVEKGIERIIQMENLDGVFEVFRKLITSEKNDHEGFHLIQRLIEHTRPEVMNGYMEAVLKELLARLQTLKTTKLVNGLLIFFYWYVVKTSASNLVQRIDNIRPSFFGLILNRIMIVEVQKVSGANEKKISCVGMTKLLCDCPEMINTNYSEVWPRLLEAIISFIELPLDESLPEDEHFFKIDDTAFTQLMHAEVKDRNPFNGNFLNPREFLAMSLHSLALANPGKLNDWIAKFSPDNLTYLNGYLRMALVQLA